jgi:hypothetical protein
MMMNASLQPTAMGGTRYKRLQQKLDPVLLNLPTEVEPLSGLTSGNFFLIF